IIRIGVLFLIGVSILGKTSYVSALDPPLVSLAFDPDSFTLSEDHAFSSDLAINGTGNVSAMEIHLIYDPDLISITSIVPNPSGKVPQLLYDYVVSPTPPDHLVTRIIGLGKSLTGSATEYRNVATIYGQGNLNNTSTSLRLTNSYYTILGQNIPNSFSSLGSMVIFSPIPAPVGSHSGSSVSFDWQPPTGAIDYRFQAWNNAPTPTWYVNRWIGGPTPFYTIPDVELGRTVHGRVAWTSGFPYSSDFSNEGSYIMPTATPTLTPTPTNTPT